VQVSVLNVQRVLSWVLAARHTWSPFGLSPLAVCVCRDLMLLKTLPQVAAELVGTLGTFLVLSLG
jgi:hypothetical protein